jgi:hypothetical protein
MHYSGMYNIKNQHMGMSRMSGWNVLEVTMSLNYI